MEDDYSFEIVQTAFRLLVLDLLALFQAMNQAMINILGGHQRPWFFFLGMPLLTSLQATFLNFRNQTPREPWISTANSPSRPTLL